MPWKNFLGWFWNMTKNKKDVDIKELWDMLGEEITQAFQESIFLAVDDLKLKINDQDFENTFNAIAKNFAKWQAGEGFSIEKESYFNSLEAFCLMIKRGQQEAFKQKAYEFFVDKCLPFIFAFLKGLI